MLILFIGAIFIVVTMIRDKGIIIEQKDIIRNYQRRIGDICSMENKAQIEINAKKKAAEAELSDMRSKVLSELNDYERRISVKKEELNLLDSLDSNLTAIPYMASIIADFETRNLRTLEYQLSWGTDQKRLKKAQSIRELRKETQALLTCYKESQYQLDYAIKMFPALEDFLETDYRTLPPVQLSDVTSDNHDSVRDYLSNEEFMKLTTVERNQLALDRYRESRRKSNWQIGRDYELYVGYKYESKGYTVIYYGSVNKLEDLGRDLVCKKGDLTLIVQCKYWSSKKQIHEKHINQLYGTMKCYCFENDLPPDSVRGVLVTNITLSETAKKFAAYLGIEIAEKFALGDYPCIKCNINHSAQGGSTKIYHLPFDQQYDVCQINKPGEFMAMTVAEAEAAGFRRAYRWHPD